MLRLCRLCLLVVGFANLVSVQGDWPLRDCIVAVTSLGRPIHSNRLQPDKLAISTSDAVSPSKREEEGYEFRASCISWSKDCMWVCIREEDWFPDDSTTTCFNKDETQGDYQKRVWEQGFWDLSSSGKLDGSDLDEADFEMI